MPKVNQCTLRLSSLTLVTTLRLHKRFAQPIQRQMTQTTNAHHCHRTLHVTLAWSTMEFLHKERVLLVLYTPSYHHSTKFRKSTSPKKHQDLKCSDTPSLQGCNNPIFQSPRLNSHKDEPKLLSCALDNQYALERVDGVYNHLV